MSKQDPKIEIDPIEAEIAEYEAKTAEAQKRIDAAEKETQGDRLTAAKAALEEKLREAAEAELVQKLTVEHGTKGKAWDTIQTGPSIVAIKRPNHMLFKRWSDNGAKDTTPELERLVKPSVLHPTWAEFQKINEEEPATLARSANVVCRLAGFRKDDLAGK